MSVKFKEILDANWWVNLGTGFKDKFEHLDKTQRIAIAVFSGLVLLGSGVAFRFFASKQPPQLTQNAHQGSIAGNADEVSQNEHDNAVQETGDNERLSEAEIEKQLPSYSKQDLTDFIWANSYPNLIPKAKGLLANQYKSSGHTDEKYRALELFQDLADDKNIPAEFQSKGRLNFLLHAAKEYKSDLEVIEKAKKYLPLVLEDTNLPKALRDKVRINKDVVAAFPADSL